MPVNAPFTAQDLGKMNRILYDLQQLNELFDKYQSCGIACEEGMIRRDALVNQLLEIKKQFFPGR